MIRFAFRLKGPARAAKAAALLSGFALDRARDWLASRRSDLDGDTLAFVRASVERDDHLKRQESRSRQFLVSAVFLLGIVVGILICQHYDFLADMLHLRQIFG